MDYMISSHGGRHNNTPTFNLPANITVKFFVADGHDLSNDHFAEPNAWGIYNHLLPGLALPGNVAYINDRVVETVSPGQAVFNYSCWNMNDIGLQAQSGIYVVGGASVNALASPTTLHDVITAINATTPTTIYWVACRSIM